MKATPQRIHNIFVKDILSAMPTSPMVVEAIKIIGPTRARELLMSSAFSISFNLINKRAAKISILPEMNLSNAIPIIAFSSK